MSRAGLVLDLFIKQIANTSLRNDLIQKGRQLYSNRSLFDNNDTSTEFLQAVLQQYFSNKTQAPAEETDVWEHLERIMGPQRDTMSKVIPITIVYCILFLTGVFGNVCTCVVIARNKYMHTATNYYLFSLAIADLLLLLIGLPQETYSFWSAYPWVFGDAFCTIRTMVAEMSTYASILTITAFTVERYVAICHPMKAQLMSSLKRAVRMIWTIWILATLCSVPLTIQYGVTYLNDQSNQTIPESALCSVEWNRMIRITLEISTFIFFVFPMTFISILYTLIACAIRRSTFSRSGSDTSGKYKLQGLELRAQQQARARRSVLKMLVAVVIAFFACWAPFHTERLMSIYMHKESWKKPFVVDIHKIIFYVSGVCYYVCCTINPILYSIMSLKFRQAFKQTLLKPCCNKRKPKRRPYFSYKFAHRNGYSETSFTSVDTGPPAAPGEFNDLRRGIGLGGQKGSSTRSVSGSSVKAVDDTEKKANPDHILFQIECFDKNCNNAKVYIGVANNRQRYGRV